MNHAFRRHVTTFLGFGVFDERQKALKSIQPHEWQRELGWLDRSGLALPLIATIKDLDLASLLPQEVARELDRRLRDNQARMEDMFKRFAEITKRFNAAGLSYTCVKGFSLLPDYLPSCEWRHQSDFDFLVDPIDIDRAEGLLERIGYKLIVRDASGERRLATPGSTIAGRDAYLYHLQESSAAELHVQLWEAEENGITLSCPANLLDSLETHTIDGASFPRLRPVYQLTYQLVHFFRHLSGTWCRLLWLYEIARFTFVHMKEEQLWREVKVFWRKSEKLEQVCLLVLRLASKIFGVRLPEEIEAGGEDWKECLLWTAHFSEISLYADLPGNKTSLLFLRPFFEDAAQYRSYRHRRLYPIGKGHALDERLASRKRRSWAYRVRGAWYQASRLAYHLFAGLSYARLQLQWNDLCRRQGVAAKSSQ